MQIAFLMAGAAVIVGAGALALTFERLDRSRDPRCPACDKCQMELYHSLHSADTGTRHFYRCPQCGARLFGTEEGSLEDASSGQFDTLYKHGPVRSSRRIHARPPHSPPS